MTAIMLGIMEQSREEVRQLIHHCQFHTESDYHHCSYGDKSPCHSCLRRLEQELRLSLVIEDNYRYGGYYEQKNAYGHKVIAGNTEYLMEGRLSQSAGVYGRAFYTSVTKTARAVAVQTSRVSTPTSNTPQTACLIG